MKCHISNSLKTISTYKKYQNNIKYFRTTVESVKPSNGDFKISKCKKNSSTDFENGFSKRVKPFRNIPGPKSLPIIGTLWAYFPIFGAYKFTNLYENCFKKFKKYGSIVREEILPGVNVVYLYKAEDIENLMRATNDRPERRSHVMVMKYRKDRPHIYNTGGLLPTNGKEWWKIRSKFQKPLSSPQKAAVYIKMTDSIVSKFINKIKEDSFWETNQNNVDFLKNISRLYLELICLIAFDVELNSFSEKEMKPNSLSSELIEATLNASKNVVKTDTIPEFILRYFPSKACKEMMEAQEKIEKAAFKLICMRVAETDTNDAIETSDGKEKSLLETYMFGPDYDFKDVIGMCIDLLLAGVDTTTFSTSFALYNLAKNKHVQEKLYEESISLLPNTTDEVTAEILSKSFYLKAVVKESLRLNPISIGIGRMVTKDIVISEYLIPKGTVAVTVNQVCSKLSEYFVNPEEFVPERWLRSSDFPKPTSPFASMPFGHGPRMCIARRLAEQDMYIVLMKLVRQFEIGWSGKDLTIVSETINKPAGPVSITLRERKP